MRKRVLTILLSLVVVFSIFPATFAATFEADNAATTLNRLGLFQGTGNGFDLDRQPTRQEAIAMIVRLLGQEQNAINKTWNHPFTDVADWATPYVGYAYTNGITSGTSSTTFGSNDVVSAAQYITFVLRALGYNSDSDFQWDRAGEFADHIGLTSGQYNYAGNFTRGDVAIVSNNALKMGLKNSDMTLISVLTATKSVSEDEAVAVGLGGYIASASNNTTSNNPSNSEHTSSSTTQSNISTYPNTSIPDFGDFANVQPIATESQNKLSVYLYNSKSVSQDTIREYFSLIHDSGFEALGGLAATNPYIMNIFVKNDSGSIVVAGIEDNEYFMVGMETSGSGTLDSDYASSSAAQTVMYADFPTVPDFGAYFGISYIAQYPSGSNSMVYTYSPASANEPNAILKYAALLEENGFKAIGAFKGSDGEDVAVAKKGNVSVSMGFMGSQFAIMITAE